jgi:tRNA (guanosine-2'-O-)-methyltransferase
MSSLRKKADKAKILRCNTLIAILENPKTMTNIGLVIRNIDTLGVSKLYVVDENNILPDNWNDMRSNRKLISLSASAIKWAFVKKFNTTKECLDHLETKQYDSIVTSPHILGETNVPLSEGSFTFPRLAVWFGNETRGVSKEAISRSLLCVQIEMTGIVESMNLAMSTGIVLYTIVQQRRKYHMMKQEKALIKAVKDNNPFITKCPFIKKKLFITKYP